MSARTATCVWRIRPELVVALDEHFGAPVDAYVNGSQVWIRDEPGPAVEWRLHPVAGFRRPPGAGTYELFEAVSAAVATGGLPPAPPEALWDGLEAFAAYGDAIEPSELADLCSLELGIPPDAVGLVDHRPIGDEWERTRGGISIIARLFEQLGS